MPFDIMNYLTESMDMSCLLDMTFWSNVGWLMFLMLPLTQRDLRVKPKSHLCGIAPSLPLYARLHFLTLYYLLLPILYPL